MSKKAKYENLTNQVIDLIGGSDNITFFTHCVTRLRMNIKDKSLVQMEELGKMEGVVGCQWSGEQLQIIIGQAVGDVYQMICEKHNLQEEAGKDAFMKNNEKQKKWKIGYLFSQILDAISGCLTPAIPVLIGSGMMKVIVLCLQTFGIMSTTNSTLQIMTYVGDAAFYFLPVIIGANAAKKFGANQGLGMALGAILIYPDFVTGIAAGAEFSFFGLPIYSASYTGTIFPIILCVWVMAPIERFFAKISPDALRSIIEPMCTLFVMIPFVLCLLAPAGAFLGTYVSTLVISLYDSVGFLGVGILSAIMPFVVMTGMHSAFVPYVLQMFGTVGYEPIFFTSLVLSNINQGAAALAVAIKTKHKVVKSTSISCAITAIVGGVSEPAMYGINLKYKTPMWAAMIGSTVAGLFAGIMHVYIYAFAGSSALFAIPCFIGGEGMENVILICVSILIGMVVTFLTTLILYKEESY